MIGNGNVAVDVARMLLLDPDELALTDTADHAIGPLSEAQVREVVLLGRRGPEHAAFTNPELRELGEMTGVDVQVDPAELEGVEEPEEPTKRGATSRSCAATPSAARAATDGGSA